MNNDNEILKYNADCLLSSSVLMIMMMRYESNELYDDDNDMFTLVMNEKSLKYNMNIIV